MTCTVSNARTEHQPTLLLLLLWLLLQLEMEVILATTSSRCYRSMSRLRRPSC